MGCALPSYIKLEHLWIRVSMRALELIWRIPRDDYLRVLMTVDGLLCHSVP